MAQLFFIVLFGLFIQAIQPCPLNLAQGSANSPIKSEKITIVTDPNAPPFVSLSSYGVPYGFDIDMMNIIAAEYRIEFAYAYAPFAQLISIVQNNTNFISISSEFITTEREKSVDFAQYFRTGSTFLIQKPSTLKISGLSDLCGLKVVVQTGTTQQEDVETQKKNCAKSIDIIPVPTYSKLIEYVTEGSADVGVYDEAILVTAVSESDGQLQIVGEQYNVQPYGILCNKDNLGLCCQLVNAINYLITTGNYKRLLQRYSYNYKSNGVCPSRINLDGRACNKKYAPEPEECKMLLN